MSTRIGIGLPGLGTVGAGVASILQTPEGRHPLIADLDLVRVAVRDRNRTRPISLTESILPQPPRAPVHDPALHAV